MHEPVKFHFNVDGENFSSAGEASVMVKKKLRQLGFPPDVMRRVSIAMYEGEINMVIHADGGSADVTVEDEYIEIVLADKGPGFPISIWRCRKGIPLPETISELLASVPVWVCPT